MLSDIGLLIRTTATRLPTVVVAVIDQVLKRTTVAAELVASSRPLPAYQN